MKEEYKRGWASIGACLGMFLMALDWTIVNAALPTIQHYFAASPLELQWMMNAYGTCIVLFIVTMGRLGDIWGHRRMFMCVLAVFGTGLLVAGFSPNPLWLITGQAIQGVGAAGLLPLSQALVVENWPDDNKNKAIALWATVAGIGIALGPVVGGLVVQFVSWRAIYFVNFPMTLFVFLIALFAMKPSPKQEQSIDVFGWLAMFIGTASFLVAVIQGPDWGWWSPSCIALYILCLVSFTALVFIENRSSNPIMPMNLFRSRVFLPAALGDFVVIGVMWVVLFLYPLYLQNLRHFSALQLGLILLATTVPVVIFPSIVEKMAARFGPKLFIVIGFFLLAISTLMSSFFHAATPVWTIVAALFVLGMGWAAMWGTATAAALSTLPKEKIATASGALNTLQDGGGQVLLAIGGSLFRFIDQNTLTHSMTTQNTTLSPTDATIVRSMMAHPDDATQYLSGLPHVIASEVLPWFSKAFLAGFSASMWALFGIALAGGIFTLVYMKMPNPEKPPG